MSFDEKKATLLSAMQAEVGRYPERAANWLGRWHPAGIFLHSQRVGNIGQVERCHPAGSRLGKSFDLRFAARVPFNSHDAGCKRSGGEFGRRG